MVDQRRLPDELAFLEASTVEELCEAIRSLAIRGAPALGVAGAMGVALAAHRGESTARAAAALIATLLDRSQPPVGCRAGPGRG